MVCSYVRGGIGAQKYVKHRNKLYVFVPGQNSEKSFDISHLIFSLMVVYNLLLYSITAPRSQVRNIDIFCLTCLSFVISRLCHSLLFGKGFVLFWSRILICSCELWRHLSISLVIISYLLSLIYEERAHLNL